MAEAPTTKRRWFRFSLRRFAVVVSVVVLALSHALSSYRLFHAEQELVQLRRDAGYLQISDESKVHFVALPRIAINTYRWRVFVPKGANYQLSATVGDLPPKGFPAGGGGVGFNAGEYLVGFELLKRADGEWEFYVSTEGARSGGRIETDQADWLNSNSGTRSETPGSDRTVAFDVGQSQLLLKMQPLPMGSYQQNLESDRGVMVWLAPSN